MKKLQLTSNAFNRGEVLTRGQLKSVMGGTFNDEQVGGVDECSRGLCSTITEETCCEGLVCKGQDGNKPGLCAVS